ncbi:MAG: cation:proton antiporter [Chloroflexota bacterium]
MESGFLDLILALAIIIVAAKAAGYISTRVGQPSVLGELLAGLILGPTAIDLFHTLPAFASSELLIETISVMAELGVILLMLLAGLELHMDELLRSGGVSALAGVLGVLVPMGLGYGTAILFGSTRTEALFMALTLSATSVSISAQTLMELEVLRSRVGLALLGAAVFDDILAILLLSIGLVVVGGAGGGIASVLLTVLNMILYLILAVALGLWVLPRLARIISPLPISQGAVAFVIIAALLYAWAAEAVGGMAAITGAFLVGLFMARTPFREQMASGVAVMAYSFFVPIFFVNIGLEVNMRAIGGSVLWYAFTITVVAIASKIIGSGAGGLLGGFSPRESLQLGIGMVSRGEVGLIVAALALSQGLFTEQSFSVAVFMVIIATLITPPLLRAAFAGGNADRDTVQGAVRREA